MSSPNLQLRADVFPISLTLTAQDGTETVYDKARAIITLDHVFIFQDAQPKPAIVFEDRLTSYTPPIASTRVRKASQLLDRKAKFETEEGFQGSFVKMGSCGCGSRLKTASLTTLLPQSPLPQAVSTNDV